MKKSSLPDKDSKPLSILTILETRFHKNNSFHPKIKWEAVLTRLQNSPQKLKTLSEMDASGGEPDVVSFEPRTKSYLFMDCSLESPTGRRSLCFDEEALSSRKEHKPLGSALGLAKKMGCELLNEEDYRFLQTLFPFDLKTSSWIETPPGIRKLGGALFCDRRYDSVFVYHNGAESYYGVRGFRGKILV